MEQGLQTRGYGPGALDPGLWTRGYGPGATDPGRQTRGDRVGTTGQPGNMAQKLLPMAHGLPVKGYRPDTTGYWLLARDTWTGARS